MQSLAKLTPPKLSGAYPRQRLFGSLDQHRDAAAIWICGPPGAGKTTLIASYLAARKLRPLWYRLDEGDADPATLFYYLGLAAKQAAPRKKKPLPLFTPEYRKGLPAFTRRYFRELYTRLPQPFVVVFDNYQDIGAETLVHEVMQYALEEVPESGNVIVMSRAEPPAQVARLRANGELKTIDPGLMRLTHDEARGIVQSRDGMELSDQCLGLLVEHTARMGSRTGAVPGTKAGREA